MISRLLDVIFMQLLRISGQQEETAGHGWLSGAIDARINPAMSAIHADPGRAWTVSDLAELSNLISLGFRGSCFQRIVGQAPLSYLTTWRLDRAAELLRYSRAPVCDIARRVGYTSEAAFSRAFKARFEVSPMRWREIRDRPVGLRLFSIWSLADHMSRHGALNLGGCITRLELRRWLPSPQWRCSPK